MGYFEKLIFEVKISVVSFGATFKKIGLLFISTSDHTGQRSNLKQIITEARFETSFTTAAENIKL